MGSLNRSLWVLVMVCLVFSLTACNFSEISDRLNPISTQKTTTAITAMVRSQPFPDFYYDTEIYDPDVVFDPNQLLAPLTHLQIRPGHTLDFVYSYDPDCGHPIVYAHKITDPRFETIEAYRAQVGECDLDLNQAACEFTDFIEIDGSREGYFEFVLLDIMGDQFYLLSHANYNETEVVTSRARLREIGEEIGSNGWNIPFTEEQKKEIRQIDPVPWVIITDEEVTVRVVYFYKWGGFYDLTVVISPSMPYRILYTEKQKLLDYDCGIIY